MQFLVVDDEGGRGSLEEVYEADAKPGLDEIGLSYCSRYFFLLPCPVTLFVDCTVRERMFVAPKHASIRCCASVCTDWCCTCSKTMICCVSGLELPGYVQVGFSRSVCSK